MNSKTDSKFTSSKVIEIILNAEYNIILEVHMDYLTAAETAEKWGIWRNFSKVIDRAMIACENSGHSVPDDFAKVSKIVEAGATSKPKYFSRYMKSDDRRIA